MTRHEEDALRAFIHAAENLRAAEAEGRNRSIRAATILKAHALTNITAWAERHARAALNLPPREEV